MSGTQKGLHHQGVCMTRNGARIGTALVISILFLVISGGTADACQCLTRTVGFWGTHPDITEIYLSFGGKSFLPVCGKKVNSVGTDACSAIQAICVDIGVEAAEEGVPTYFLQLVRQLTAARLNLRATWTEGGGCTQELTDLVADCDHLCEAFTKGTATRQQLLDSECVE